MKRVGVFLFLILVSASFISAGWFSDLFGITGNVVINNDYIESLGGVSWWRFEGNLNDEIGNNNGEFSGPVINCNGNRKGKFGTGCEFIGADYVIIPDDDSLDFGTGDFSVSVWIKTSENGKNMGIVSKSANVEPYNEWATYLSRDNKLYALLWLMNGPWNNSGPGKSVTTSNSYNDGQWHHVVYVFDRESEMKVYVDGSLKGFNDLSSLSGLSVSNNLPFEIGRAQSNYNQVFNGVIDEVIIFNKALTTGEIGGLYNGIVEESECATDDDCPEEKSESYCSGDASCVNATSYSCVLGICVASSGAKGCALCSDGCEEGVCVGLETCTDSDGGLDYYEKGTVIAPAANNAEYADYCLESNVGGLVVQEGRFVREYYCDRDIYGYETYECPNGCENGACVGGDRDCVAEGGQRPWGEECCEGLTAVNDVIYSEENGCDGLESNSKYCIKIGDGVFKDGVYEGPEDICTSVDCVESGGCETVGLRSGGKYCSPDKQWVSQKVVDSSCENNFECKSNNCLDEKCVDVIEKIESQASSLKRFFCRILSTISFGGINYEECVGGEVEEGEECGSIVDCSPKELCDYSTQRCVEIPLCSSDDYCEALSNQEGTLNYEYGLYFCDEESGTCMSECFSSGSQFEDLCEEWDETLCMDGWKTKDCTSSLVNCGYLIRTERCGDEEGGETIEIGSGGMRYFELKNFPLKESIEDINFLYGFDGFFKGTGKDSDHLLRTGINAITFDADTDEYFIATYFNPYSEERGESYLMRATNFKEGASATVNKTTIQYRKDGVWTEIMTVGDPDPVRGYDRVSIGKISFDILAVNKDEKTVTIMSGGNTDFRTIISKEGILIFLPPINEFTLDHPTRTYILPIFKENEFKESNFRGVINLGLRINENDVSVTSIYGLCEIFEPTPENLHIEKCVVDDEYKTEVVWDKSNTNQYSAKIIFSV